MAARQNARQISPMCSAWRIGLERKGVVVFMSWVPLDSAPLHEPLVWPWSYIPGL